MKGTGPVNNLRLLKTVSCDTGGNGEMMFHSQDPLQIQGYNIVIITTKQLLSQIVPELHWGLPCCDRIPVSYSPEQLCSVFLDHSSSWRTFKFVTFPQERPDGNKFRMLRMCMETKHGNVLEWPKVLKVVQRTGMTAVPNTGSQLHTFPPTQKGYGFT